MLFSRNTKFSFDRSIWDYTLVKQIRNDFIRGKKSLISRNILAKSPYLNIGCGPNVVSNFINLDYEWRPGIDICWDITKRLPLGDNSILGIFSEHCLEHIPFRSAIFHLGECYRILQPNGTMRLIVPDAEKYIDIYVQRKLGTNIKFPYQNDDETTPIMSLNRVFRNHGHCYAYDYETLVELIRNSGFSSITKVDFREGKDPVLFLDSEWRAVESIYLEIQK